MEIEFKEPEVSHFRLLKSIFNAKQQELQRVTLEVKEAEALLKSYLTTLAQLYGVEKRQGVFSDDCTTLLIQDVVDGEPGPFSKIDAREEKHEPIHH